MIKETNKASDRYTEVIFECDFCHIDHSLIVANVDFFKFFVLGHKVHEAFTSLSPDDREKFMTGMCDDCNKRIFAETDDESDAE